MQSRTADTVVIPQGMQSLIEAGRSVDGNGATATVRSSASTSSMHSNVSGLIAAARQNESHVFADTGRNRTESG